MPRGKKIEPQLPPPAPQDRGGFISPNLARMRREASDLSRERRQVLRNIEAQRAAETPVMNVNTPQLIQSTGRPQHAYRNNNPGNLVFAGQTGATKAPDSNFAQFPDRESGYYALENQVRLDQTRDLSLAKFVEKYAPSHENDTERYISMASRRLGVDPNTNIRLINTRDLSMFLANYESGTRVSPSNLPLLPVNTPSDRYPRY